MDGERVNDLVGCFDRAAPVGVVCFGRIIWNAAGFLVRVKTRGGGKVK